MLACPRRRPGHRARQHARARQPWWLTTQQVRVRQRASCELQASSQLPGRDLRQSSPSRRSDAAIEQGSAAASHRASLERAGDPAGPKLIAAASASRSPASTHQVAPRWAPASRQPHAVPAQRQRPSSDLPRRQWAARLAWATTHGAAAFEAAKRRSKRRAARPVPVRIQRRSIVDSTAYSAQAIGIARANPATHGAARVVVATRARPPQPAAARREGHCSVPSARSWMHASTPLGLPSSMARRTC